MDLNDMRYFALVVEHGGFSAAERAAHVTNSKLSRRVAALEEQLGVRLLQRSTRQLALTEAGQAFYEHCAAMLVEADAAQEAIEHLRSEPSGTVRITCPLVMTQFYGAKLIAEFMRLHPKVRVELEATDRVMNLIEERIDVALRARDTGLRDPGLTARRVASGRMVLVSSPSYLDGRKSVETPQQAVALDTIGSLSEGADQTWSLRDSTGYITQVSHRPRLLCSDFAVQYESVRGGVGIALLPQRIAWRGLHDGTLVRVAKDWATPEQDIHLVYASRRGMLPAVRALIDFLVERMPTALAD